MTRTSRAVSVTSLVLLSALASPAENVTWRGVNTAALYTLLGTGVHDLSPYTNANTVTTGGGYNLWSPARVPTAGDTAVFAYDTSQTSVFGYTAYPIVLDGDFSPDHLRLYSTLWNSAVEGSAHQTRLMKNLSLQTLYLAFGNSSANQGENKLVVGTGYVLTLTGADPISFAGTRGAWATLAVSSGATLRFTGAAQTFASHNYNTALHGSGTVEFTTPDATLTLGAPGIKATPTIHLRNHLLRISPTQTWLNPSHAGHIRVLAANGRAVIDAIGGGRLDNLGQVALMIGIQGSTTRLC